MMLCLYYFIFLQAGISFEVVISSLVGPVTLTEYTPASSSNVGLIMRRVVPVLGFVI